MGVGLQTEWSNMHFIQIAVNLSPFVHMLYLVPPQKKPHIQKRQEAKKDEPHQMPELVYPGISEYPAIEARPPQATAFEARWSGITTAGKNPMLYTNICITYIIHRLYCFNRLYGYSLNLTVIYKQLCIYRYVVSYIHYIHLVSVTSTSRHLSHDSLAGDQVPDAAWDAAGAGAGAWGAGATGGWRHGGTLGGGSRVEVTGRYHGYQRCLGFLNGFFEMIWGRDIFFFEGGRDFSQDFFGVFFLALFYVEGVVSSWVYRDFLTWILGTFWNGGRGWNMEKKDEKKQVTFPQWHAWGGQQKPISSGLLFFMQYRGNWVGFNFCICKLFEFLASISSSVIVYSGIVLTDLPASEFGTPWERTSRWCHHLLSQLHSCYHGGLAPRTRLCAKESAE